MSSSPETTIADVPAEILADLRARMQGTDPAAAEARLAQLLELLASNTCQWRRDQSGRLTGGIVYWAEGHSLALNWVHVLPGYESDTAFADWIRKRCLELCRRLGCRAIGSYTPYVFVLGEEPAAGLLERAGFASHPTYALTRDLSLPIPAAEAPPEYDMRNYRAEDLEGVAAMMSAARELPHVRLGVDLAACRRHVETFQAPEELKLVVEWRGRIVGYILTNALGFISNLGVAPEHRSRKLGFLLFTEIFRRLRDRGVAYATGTADAETPAVARLYQPLGVIVAATYRAHVLEVDFDPISPD